MRANGCRFSDCFCDIYLITILDFSRKIYSHVYNLFIAEVNIFLIKYYHKNGLHCIYGRVGVVSAIPVVFPPRVVSVFNLCSTKCAGLLRIYEVYEQFVV